MKESYVESQCVKLAKSLGYDTRKLKFIAQNGAPDRLFMKPGRLVWVELKAQGGSLSELQIYQQKLLIDAGQEVHTVFSTEQLMEILK